LRPPFKVCQDQNPISTLISEPCAFTWAHGLCKRRSLSHRKFSPRILSLFNILSHRKMFPHKKDFTVYVIGGSGNSPEDILQTGGERWGFLTSLLNTLLWLLGP
jgi:hypothetical protein